MPGALTFVPYTCDHALNHRQFQQLLIEVESQYGDVIYYSEVRWLSRGKVLKRVLDLNVEIHDFMRSKGKLVKELVDPQWLCDLAYLVDITSHLNDLNTNLQGKNQLIVSMLDHVKAFCTKLRLFQRQVTDHNFTHFPGLST